jgi:hypothetical protein
MAPDSPRAPRDGDMRFLTTATVSIFGFVLGFVATMTFMGVSPWEAVGIAIAAGTATGTIARLLQDLLRPGPPPADRQVPPEPTNAEPATEAPTEIRQQTIPPESTEGIG